MGGLPRSSRARASSVRGVGRALEDGLEPHPLHIIYARQAGGGRLGRREASHDGSPVRRALAKLPPSPTANGSAMVRTYLTGIVTIMGVNHCRAGTPPSPLVVSTVVWLLWVHASAVGPTTAICKQSCGDNRVRASVQTDQFRWCRPNLGFFAGVVAAAATSAGLSPLKE